MATYTQIASYTVSAVGGDSSITFSNISQAYTDLVVKISARSTSTAGALWSQLYVSYNGLSNNISYRSAYGTGSATSSGFGVTNSNLGAFATDSSATASTFSNGEIYIPNYTNSTLYKSSETDVVTENNAANALSYMQAGLSGNTTPITSLVLSLQAGNFAQYSTAYLYGIKNS